MFGCCGLESRKFVTDEGNVDKGRLEVLVQNIKNSDRPEEHKQRFISEVTECTCACHIDGAWVMC